jgi:hypothetical protein
MLLRLISAPRYWIELRLMYVVDVSEKLSEIVRVRVRVRVGVGVRVGVRVQVGVEVRVGVGVWG